jgi:hypothetical protein
MGANCGLICTPIPVTVRRFRLQFTSPCPRGAGAAKNTGGRLGLAKEDGPDKRLGSAGNWASRPSRRESWQRRNGSVWSNCQKSTGLLVYFAVPAVTHRRLVS